eukprot:7385995-Prymnesium_polylepis.1
MAISAGMARPGPSRPYATAAHAKLTACTLRGPCAQSNGATSSTPQVTKSCTTTQHTMTRTNGRILPPALMSRVRRARCCKCCEM